jgi:hypothetical protein
MSKTSQRKSQQLSKRKKNILDELQDIEYQLELRAKQIEQWDSYTSGDKKSGCVSTRPVESAEDLNKRKQFLLDLLIFLN